MKADFNFDVTDAALIVNPDNSGLAIRFQTVEQPPGGPQRSGKYIHLSMIPAQAMRLLALLEGLRKTAGWAIPADVQLIQVPQVKDRH